MSQLRHDRGLAVGAQTRGSDLFICSTSTAGSASRAEREELTECLVSGQPMSGSSSRTKLDGTGSNAMNEIFFGLPGTDDGQDQAVGCHLVGVAAVRPQTSECQRRAGEIRSPDLLTPRKTQGVHACPDRVCRPETRAWVLTRPDATIVGPRVSSSLPIPRSARTPRYALRTLERSPDHRAAPRERRTPSPGRAASAHR